MWTALALLPSLWPLYSCSIHTNGFGVLCIPSLFGLQYVFSSCLRKIRRIRNNEQGVEKKVILEGVGDANYYRTIRTNPLAHFRLYERGHALLPFPHKIWPDLHHGRRRTAAAFMEWLDDLHVATFFQDDEGLS